MIIESFILEKNDLPARFVLRGFCTVSNLRNIFWFIRAKDLIRVAFVQCSTNISQVYGNTRNVAIQYLIKPEVPHYSKSQIFVQKFNFDNPPTFSRVFQPKFFWQFFSWNQSCQQLKSPKPQHFHEFFTQKNRHFFREIFGQNMKISNSVRIGNLV